MHPIFTLVLFNMLFSFYHIPVVHDYVMTHFTRAPTLLFYCLLTAFMMWWQIAYPVPEWNRLTDLRKMAYIFANGCCLPGMRADYFRPVPCTRHTAIRKYGRRRWDIASPAIRARCSPDSRGLRSLI